MLSNSLPLHKLYQNKENVISFSGTQSKSEHKLSELQARQFMQKFRQRSAALGCVTLGQSRRIHAANWLACGCNIDINQLVERKKLFLFNTQIMEDHPYM
jgi:hypothetical protein